MKWRRGDIGALLTIIVVVVLFFLPLFWPKQQILVTPDFGKSDAWHFSFATKFFLWESLHQNKLPLWTDKIGGGFPIFAEGQIGTFFLPNLIIFKLINDPIFAYNINLVTTILILATGMYVWLRSIKLTILSSLFGALTLTFSGIVILQLPHITLLQGFSLLPWMMASVSQPLLFAFLLSQQFFAGFPQATFLTLLLTGSWAMYQKKLFPFVVAVFAGFGLSAIQLLPSWEFLKEVGMPKGLPPEIASYFSFPLVHLKSFFNPFALGDPKMGTYPHFAQFNGSIFWENTGYIGMFPLMLLLIPVRFRTRLTTYFLAILFSSFLLMWGSNSPLYLLYSFWPFNLFRAPSRFLWIFIFILSTLASMGFQKVLHRKIAIVLALVTIIQLFFMWKDYHLLVPAKIWVERPTIASLIPKDSRITTIGAEKTHNTFFLSKGWQNPNPYQKLRSTLAPDSNLLWDINSHDVYAGRFLRRSTILDTFASSHIHMSETDITISQTGQKLLDLMGITHIISTLPMQKPVIYDEKISDALGYTRLAVNTTATNRTYLASSTTPVTSVEDAQTELSGDAFIPGKSALIEEPITLETNTHGTATITSSQHNEVIIKTESETRALLVLSDTYYPGWLATVDKMPATIVPINIKYRGIVVPSGSHTVTFTYKPKSFIVGAFVSAGAFIIFTVLTAFRKRFALSQTRQKVHRRAPYSRNRGKRGPRKE